MIIKQDGGPAFPIAGEFDGMLLRDWFAGQAMKALVETGHFNNSKEMSAHAYSLADAMIEGREEGWL
jgi:uncharacterized protein YodC (DUF2158 family)